MSVERRIEAFLHLVEEDLNAAELLARIGNHFAAYHAQQAIEKIVKALLLGRGIEAGTEHRLEHLVERLPMNDAWRASLDPWLHYSAYATAFRYPTPGGRIPSGPAATVLLEDVVRLRALVRIARAERPRGA